MIRASEENPFTDSVREECGVFGICAPNADVVSATFHALFSLQHRGQESAGMAVNRKGVIELYKDVGLVGEVFTPDVMRKLGDGELAMGHVRYATTGDKRISNAQPLLVNHLKGSMALCHNGNLTNAHELREKLELRSAIFHTTSDTEVMAYVITQERLQCQSIELAVARAMKRIRGAYTAVVMSPRKLIAFRDPLGFRPLCIGKLDGGYVFASETCALDAIGASFVRDVAPGEIVVATTDGQLTSIQTEKSNSHALCVFELIYFARPDSVIDGTSVHESRLKAGALLAINHPVQADVVVGVPDSGLDAALGYARQSGIPYGIGFIKNKYIGRTFIEPGQSARAHAVRIKLNPVAETVRGKRVVLVDDSLVRGTTQTRIVKLLREVGAKEVHVRLSAPPFRYPCFFGTDVDSVEHLIAHNHSLDEIREIIGADSLEYFAEKDLPKLDRSGCGRFCDACFTGNYPVSVPKRQNKNKFETRIGEESDADDADACAGKRD
ncbi:MAG: amidophosphoribosyltransferase [Oscillospiraceae bacterium]|jgi:amidophosphoribosyltransferase|nr:amidophosphoribosyltransferase [Oscillospiraceae bacterium]